MTTSHNARGAVKIARDYIDRGFSVIPTPPKSKSPTVQNWQLLRIKKREVAQYFDANSNIGVLNGEPSGGLIDVDLDHPIARELADKYLPPTEAEFGRESAPRSHRLYRVNRTAKTMQRRLPKTNGKAQSIVELRSTGSQTLFPGSVHPNGERIEWHKNGEPAEIALNVLVTAVKTLAAAVELRLGIARPPRNDAEVPADVTRRVLNFLATVPPAVSGQGGHDQTFYVARMLVHEFGLDRSAALPHLKHYNQLCTPPWSEKELEHKIDDAIKQQNENHHTLNGNAGRRNGGDGNQKDHKSQSTIIVELAAECELFHDADNEAFARYPVGEDDSLHFELSRVRSKPYRRWISRRFYLATGNAPSAQPLQDALGLIEAKALFDGQQRDVFLRVGQHAGRIFLDLGNSRWQAVEIDATGWLPVDESPVAFRRAKAMLPLPTPVLGGDVSALRRFVNVSDDDWPLLLATLVAMLRPTGPYPVLAVYGEHGSAKSTLCRYIRRIIDPNTSPLRGDYREPRDLMICANNGWIVALDNLSSIPPWLSDCLCRLSTGGGFSTRTLFENDEETIFNSMRPVILNCIDETVTRSDLLDRCVLLNLPRIDAKNRVPESQLDREFEIALPGILGGLLTAASTAMRNEKSTKLPAIPRMADFAIWSTAAEPGLGLKPGAFLKAYNANREAGNEIAIEASPIARAIVDFMKELETWSDTATKLLEELNLSADQKLQRLRNWPRSPQALGSSVKRVAPNLREAGVEVEFCRTGKGRTITLVRKPR